MSRRDDISCKVYVGDLSKDASEKDLERAFDYYGPLKKVWVARNPPGIYHDDQKYVFEFKIAFIIFHYRYLCFPQ